MKASKVTRTVAWILAMACLFAARASYAQTCTDDGTYELCATVSLGDPLLGSDLTVAYTAGVPKVTLFTGDSDWKLWAHEKASPSTLADIGEITLDPNAATADFTVSIMKGTGTGAVNAGSINLIDSDTENGPTWTGGSNIGQVIVSEDITGVVKTVKDSSGNDGQADDIDVGGDIQGVWTIAGDGTGDLTVGGELSGVVVFLDDYSGTSIDIPTLAGNLQISGDVTNNADMQFDTIGTNGIINIVGDLAGDITVSTILQGEIDAHTTPSATDIVTIEDFGSSASVNLGGAWWHGKVDLKSGIPAGASVTIAYFAGELLLNNNPVAGTLSIGSADHKTKINPDAPPPADPGTNGIVADGGHVTWGSLATPCFNYVRGEAKFHSVAKGGKIECENQMEGRINIVGDMKGSIILEQTLEPYDLDDCEEECEGIENHNCVNNCAGMPCEAEILIGGDVIPDATDTTAGRIEVHQVTKVGSSIEITGEVAGVIELREDCKATIDVDDDVSGSIEIDGDLAADLVIGGDLSGALDIDDDVLADIDIGSVSGQLDIADLLSADVSITGALTSSATIDTGAITGGATITVDGESAGDIGVDRSTAIFSVIHLAGGLASGGSVTVNTGDGDYDAGGAIAVGSLSGSPVSGNYDGVITIKDNSASDCSGRYGDLDGSIRIAVCDNEATDHVVCVEGDGQENITVVDATCGYQPDVVCLSCE